MCGLEAFADAAVGSLEVEQRKRTTIGVELAAKARMFSYKYNVLLNVRYSPNYFYSWTSLLQD
jgi:hypothetical protein